MKNLLKNFYCDYVFLKAKISLSFLSKIKFLIEKYVYFFFSIFGLRIRSKFLKNTYFPSGSLGLLELQIMIKDFHDYYFIPSLKKPIVFDVGAHIGNFAMASKLFYKNSDVYCFEPISKTYEILKKNTKIFSNIHSFNVAVGCENKTSKMYFQDNELDRSSFNKNNLIDNGSAFSQEVEMVRLSTFMEKKNISSIDILKIDVEGFEAEVLKGLGEYLGKVKHIIVEIHMGKDNEKLNEVLSILSAKRFKMIAIGKIWQDLRNRKDISCFDLIFRKL